MHRKNTLMNKHAFIVRINLLIIYTYCSRHYIFCHFFCSNTAATITVTYIFRSSFIIRRIDSCTNNILKTFWFTTFYTRNFIRFLYFIIFPPSDFLYISFQDFLITPFLPIDFFCLHVIIIFI
jgi:hypothetical protein